MSFPVCFLGISTTGDDPAVHSLWEISAILHGHPRMKSGTYQWQVNPDLGHADADKLNAVDFDKRQQFKRVKHSRVGDGYTVEHTHYKAGKTTPDVIAQELGDALSGTLIVGVNPPGWLPFLSKFVGAYGVPSLWQEHVVDSLALAAGYMLGKIDHTGNKLVMPNEFDAAWITGLLGVVPPSEANAATALGNARWSLRLYERVMGALQ